MNTLPFFPNVLFAWAFVLTLLGLLAVAAYSDTKRLVVPKSLTLATLGLGFLFTVARGAWNGTLDGHTRFLIADGGPLGGAADGLLFAIAGFLVGFSVFFAFWILGVAGGGDVKVMAALGTWLGPAYVLGAVLFSFPVVVLLMLLAPVIGLSHKVAPAPGGTKPRRRLMSYTLPLAVAVAGLLFLGFKYELGLATK